MNREIANLEAIERRETEFQQSQKKERGPAIDAQQKLRELAAQELQERVHLERELAKQQQQNLLLQSRMKLIAWRHRLIKNFWNKNLAVLRSRP